MQYYPQRFQTDCLLAATECLIQKPREEIYPNFAKWHYIFGDYYLDYVSSALIIMEYARCVPCLISKYFTSRLILDDSKMILGLVHPNERALHAVFYDGEKIYDPWTEEFYSCEKINVDYAILLDTKNNMAAQNFLIHAYMWDSGNNAIFTGLQPPIKQTINIPSLEIIKLETTFE